jgi:hypothetical protein
MLSHRHGEYTVPRGAKKDITVSKLLYENGLLLDKRSFISLGAEPHLYLKGRDVEKQWDRLWESTVGSCANCRLIIYGNWVMDHKQGGLVGRCDCLHNLQVLCPPCHRAKHVRPRFKGIPLEAEA